jgi:RHS repeat-associated protein
MKSRLVRLAALAALVAARASFAQGAIGVSAERVTLPGAPGSLDGLGSNAISEGNQGSLAYNVAIDAIPGFPGLTPQLALEYSSNGGSTVAGIGWSLPTFSIERRTIAGLQKYKTTDSFVVNGSEELVLVAQDSTSQTYRQRFEGAFVRYTWKNPATGENGYWTAEFPDGRTAYYGADTSGTQQAAAEVIVPSTTPQQVFRWHMVSMVDQYGHEMRLSWTKNSTGFPLLDRIDYVFDGSTARHSVRFTYETRGDLISDARPGFEMLLDQRVKTIGIYSATELVRAYTMAYEADTASGGASRLQSVARFGRNNVQFPVVFNFAYTQTIGATCTTGNCDKPYVVDMGTLGNVDFSTGHATLIDINGDALPDVLYADATGHHFYYAKLDSEGHASFSMTPVNSTKVTQGTTYVIGDPKTQLLDVNGDGFVDIAQAATNSVLCNKGTGDWVDASQCTGTNINLPANALNAGTDATSGNPLNVRFFDYDNDRRIDWLHTIPGGATEVMANTATMGFVTVPVQDITVAFDQSPLELADMNGDGMQDPVEVFYTGSGSNAVVQTTYRLNYGYGNWGPWKTIILSGFDTGQADVAEVEDINGDGLSDIVSVTGTQVSIAINRNGARFDAVRTITDADLSAGHIPARVSGTTIVFADMNGNGSDDIVWIDQTGHVQYLEMFPVRPNLLTRIDNGVGAVQLITYGSSVTEQARDKNWKYKLPHPATVVTSMVSYVTLTGTDTGGLREITNKAYHTGYYDGVEKQFRGYETVDETLVADMSRDAQEPGVITTTYDLGQTDPLFAGAMQNRLTYSTATGQPVLLLDERWLHDACNVDQVPMGTMPAIHFLCEKAETTVHVERDATHAMTTRVEHDYDGYGNVVAERNLGVVNQGTPEAPMACDACMASGVFGAPCGATCDGDEWYVQREYVVPGTDTSGAWFPHAIKHELSGAVMGMPGEEELTYYDGPDFDGLPSGQLTKGSVTKLTVRKGPNATDFLPIARYKRDMHGNIVVSLPTAAMPSGTSDGRTVTTYENAGLNPTQVELMVSGPMGQTAVRSDYSWDSAWEQPASVSDWYPEASGTALGTPQVTNDRYDEHGRMLRRLSPGETDATASMELSYTLASPASKVQVLRRSQASGMQDLVDVRCFDGKGRLFQTREQLTPSKWQVTGFTEFDARGRIVRQYQPYIGSAGDCEMAPPTGVLFDSYKFDVLGRVMQQTLADGATMRTEYLPLGERHYDENDTDAQATFTNTPTIRAFDGQGRLIAVSRLSQALGSGTPSTTRTQYDSRGNVSAVYDPGGNLHSQVFGYQRQLDQITDPDRGSTKFDYDDNGNVIRRTDARGAKTHTVFDALNRPVERFDEADEMGTRVDWSYDLLPDCTECTNGGLRLVQTKWAGSLAGSVRFGYDGKARDIYEERIVGTTSLVTRHRYDAADRPVSVTWPGGLSMDTTFDGADRITGMSGVLSGIDYEDRGKIAAMHFVNGVNTQYTYDARERITAIKTIAKDNTALLDLGYTWNPRGDLLAITDGMRDGRARHAGGFTYDAYGRLTAAALKRTGDDEMLSLGYDELDNITSKTSSLASASRAHVGTYTYDAMHKNAVTVAGTLTYQYDEDGAMTARGDTTFKRDSEGRLVGATSQGAETGTYAFADAERVAKLENGFTTLYLGDHFVIRDGIATAYPRLGTERVARLQTDALAAQLYSDLAPASGSGMQLSVMGDGTIDIGDAWLAQAAGLQLVQLSGGPTPSSVDGLLRSAARRLLMTDATMLHSDHLESPVLATDSSGAVRGERSYYPSGDVRDDEGFVDEYGFTGSELDVATGLLHFEHRDLDPSSARWDRPDPAFERLSAEDILAEGEATTGYAYVRNAMMNAVDPDGLQDKGVAALKKAGSKAKMGKQKGRLARANSWSNKPFKGSKFTKGDVIRMVLSLVLNVTAFALQQTAQAGGQSINSPLNQAGSWLARANMAVTGYGLLKTANDARKKNADEKEAGEKATAKEDEEDEGVVMHPNPLYAGNGKAENKPAAAKKPARAPAKPKLRGLAKANNVLGRQIDAPMPGERRSAGEVGRANLRENGIGGF